MALVDEAEFAADIRRHIEECDRMYSEIYGCCSDAPECNTCKKLLKMGFLLTPANLPEICIMHCERWRLPEEVEPLPEKPVPLPAAPHLDVWPGFSTGGLKNERVPHRL